MNNQYSIQKALPVLFGFFIMGFVDVVGISTSYVQSDFNLSETMANLLPMMVFLWFAVFSVPTGILMNRIGRKKTVLLSMVITLMALLLPIIHYRYTTILIAFAFLGVGNTLLQVSLNPLVSNVVNPHRLPSVLTFGQFIKAVAAFSGPILAGFAVVTFGNWKLIFPVYASVAVISTIWLYLTSVREEPLAGTSTSFKSAFRLLGNKLILSLFLGILLVVGVDVGMNVSIPRFLGERTGMILEQAGLGTSLYFAARTAGAFLGAILLVRYSPYKFYQLSMVVAILSMGVMLFSNNPTLLLVMIAVIGFTIANIFPIIFSAALKSMPLQANEISGLMIMGVAGGAFLPPVMGALADLMGQTGALLILFTAMIFLLLIGFFVGKWRPQETV